MKATKFVLIRTGKVVSVDASAVAKARHRLAESGLTNAQLVKLSGYAGDISIGNAIGPFSANLRLGQRSKATAR